MKRILCLDGGGIRGVFTLEVLLKIEEVLREYYAKQDPKKAEKFVLRDHFDFLAGTSTGAIIATCLCWGMSIEQVRDLYLREGQKMFSSWGKMADKLNAKYDPGPISKFLQGLFKEMDGSEAMLSSDLLRNGEKDNLLMVVLRNHTDGSPWLLTNNQHARYNDPSGPYGNVQIPLWMLVRASTAAPAFFPPERIELGETESVFVDGSITPYSNPALIAALTAIMPSYRIQWPTGPENIRVVSIGTLSFSSELPVSNPKLLSGALADKVPAALLQSIGCQQDYLCRCLGECIFGEEPGGEFGDLLVSNPESAPPPGRSWFSYVRYNRSYKKKEMQNTLREHPDLARLDAAAVIHYLIAVGRQYAEANVKLEHLV